MRPLVSSGAHSSLGGSRCCLEAVWEDSVSNVPDFISGRSFERFYTTNFKDNRSEDII